MSDVVPFDLGQRSRHESSNNDESATTSPWWDTGNDWRKEERKEKEESAKYCGEASAGSCFHSSTTLNEGSHRRKPEQGSKHGSQGVSSKSLATLWEVTGFVDVSQRRGKCQQGTLDDEKVRDGSFLF